eukprot:scaffold2816_cov105-Isochrysis_galbana.AAC.1
MVLAVPGDTTIMQPQGQSRCSAGPSTRRTSTAVHAECELPHMKPGDIFMCSGPGMTLREPPACIAPGEGLFIGVLVARRGKQFDRYIVYVADIDDEPVTGICRFTSFGEATDTGFAHSFRQDWPRANCSLLRLAREKADKDKPFPKAEKINSAI